MSEPPASDPPASDPPVYDPVTALAPPPSWSDAPRALLDAGGGALAAGLPPAPLLLPYEGDEPLATVVLRPFGPGELTDALVELLALLLPLGADRVALGLPGRAWSTADPIPPVSNEVDLRTSVLLVVTADAHEGPCRVRAELHPYAHDGTGLGDPVHTGQAPEAPALDALRCLLDARGELGSRLPDIGVAAQLARVLLLGHEIRLSPTAALLLEHSTVAGPVA